LIMALHRCAGRNFGIFKCVGGPKRVAVISVEEDQDELDRRLHAIRKVFDYNDDAAANLFIVHMETPIIAQTNGRGVVRPTDIAKELEQQLGRLVVDLVLIDPFVEVWDGNENDNSQVRSALAVIRGICRRMNAACMLMHHVKKGGVTPGDVEAGRGASSLAGLVRLAHTITNMTKDEAAALNIPNNKGIVRIDHAKGNYLPAPETAEWFEFRSIELDNADEVNPVGDHVGVLVPWALPGLFAGITDAALSACLDELTVGLPEGERYSFLPQGKDRYAALAIAEALAIEEERAARIMRAWKRSGLLFEKEYFSERNRKTRKGVYVDAEKRPLATTAND